MNRKKGFTRSRDFIIAIIVIIGAFLIPGSYYLGKAIESGEFGFGAKTKEEKKEVIRGVFGVYPEVMLRSATDYGDFEVSGWEKEEYEIVVTFEARARKTERAISLLDECSVVLEKGIVKEQIKFIRDLPREKEIISPWVLPSSLMPKFDMKKCTGCLIRERMCPYNAITVDKEKSNKVNDKYCMGCGMCVGACPENAITLIERKTGEEIWNGRGTAKFKEWDKE